MNHFQDSFAASFLLSEILMIEELGPAPTSCFSWKYFFAYGSKSEMLFSCDKAKSSLHTHNQD